jgi:hypothetical protein
MNDKVLAAPPVVDRFGEEESHLETLFPRRINADPTNVQRGLAQLVLTVVELLRELMERQALRRIDGGGLTDEQIERLGATFMALRERMEELKHDFGLDEEDLNLDLGPLGRLL